MLSVISRASASAPQQYASLSTMLSALAGQPGYVLVPEQETGSLISGMSSANRDALSSYVRNGGVLIYALMGDSNALLMCNTLFGWSITKADCSSSSTSLDSGEASGTSFSGGPATLPTVNAVNCVSRSSLPAGTRSAYKSGTAVSVFQAAVESGRVIGLAPDWYETSSEWDSVLMRAVQTVAGCPAGQYLSGCGGTSSGVLPGLALSCSGHVLCYQYKHIARPVRRVISTDSAVPYPSVSHLPLQVCRELQLNSLQNL